MTVGIPFHRPYLTGEEQHYIQQAVASGQLSGDGEFTQRCQHWLERYISAGDQKVLLTPSGTAALEMAAILTDIQPGDEIIMPSYTFVSTANAFVLRGGVPVFIDIREDTFNLDETLIEAAITSKTKAIVAVHYAGVGCNMHTIMAIAQHYDLVVIEDAAQGLMADYDGQPLGSFGHLAAFSFHATKNIQCGEGGALVINDSRYRERAQWIWEKGTNRSQFIRGEVDKYTWVDIGSSYLPSEVTAAFLYAQLTHAQVITVRRLAIWNRYRQALGGRAALLPELCQHNAHLYDLTFPSTALRNDFLANLQRHNIDCATHYMPLHTSLAGKKFARVASLMPNTEAASHRSIRLPLWNAMSDQDVERVINVSSDFLHKTGYRSEVT